MKLFIATLAFITGLLLGACTDLYPESMCDAICHDSTDCIAYNGFCATYSEGFEFTTICTQECGIDGQCEEGFICIPLFQEVGYNWQCVLTDLGVCR